MQHTGDHDGHDWPSDKLAADYGAWWGIPYQALLYFIATTCSIFTDFCGWQQTQGHAEQPAQKGYAHAVHATHHWEPRTCSSDRAVAVQSVSRRQGDPGTQQVLTGDMP